MIFIVPPPPPGQAYCPNCGGFGNTGECESEPGKLYDCYVCGNSGYVSEACAAEWNQDMDERAAMEEAQESVAERIDHEAYPDDCPF